MAAPGIFPRHCPGALGSICASVSLLEKESLVSSVLSGGSRQVIVACCFRPQRVSLSRWSGSLPSWGARASQWATASPSRSGETCMPTFFGKYLCWEPCANVVSAHSRLWGQCRAVPALQIETGWNGHVGHQDFSPNLEKTRHSLAVQGSGFCASLSGAVSIPAQGTKIPWAKWCGQKRKEKKTNN